MLFSKPQKFFGVPEGTLFPIASTEKIIAQLAGSFADASKFRLEVFGYLIGLDANRLTHLVVPEHVLGIRQDRNDEMRFVTDTRGRTQVIFAVHASTDQLGLLVATSPKNMDHRLVKGHLSFFPIDALIPNRPLGDYLPPAARHKWFPATHAEKVGPRQVIQTIRQSGEKISTHLLNHDDQWVVIEFLPQLTMGVDAFVSSTKVYPFNDFMLNALEMNRFEDPQKRPRDKVYGRVHVHYAYRYHEIMSDGLIHALHRHDNNFFELMTPVDAISMLESGSAAREISDRQWRVRQRVEGVVALDPTSLDIVGASYFDISRLTTDEAVVTFGKLAREAHDSRNIAANIRWFEYIRNISQPKLSTAIISD